MKKFVRICAAALCAGLLLSQPAFAASSGIFVRALFPLCAGKFIAPIAESTKLSVSLAVLAHEAEEKAEAERVDRGHVAYVVRANQRLNMETGKYYGELTLINETGLFDVVTVEDVENYNFMPVFTTERIGRISEWEGTFVQFDMKKTDKIQKLETRRSTVKNKFDGEDGFYRVNVVAERNGILSFYDTSADVDTASAGSTSLAYHENGHAVIAISGGDYAGDALSKISSKEAFLEAGVGNAVIQVYEGEVVRVFSFAE